MHRCATPKRRPVKAPSICLPRLRHFRSYDSIVRHYMDRYREYSRKELDYFRRMPNLREAIRAAALARDRCGHKHPHQWRIPRATLKVWDRELSRKAAALRACKEFHGLMEHAERIAKGIWGIGELTVYDTIHRIGAYLGKSPAKVYMHAGTRTGAKALGFGGNRRLISPRDLPRAFRRLEPYELEDCLCIYKHDFMRIPKRS